VADATDQELERIDNETVDRALEGRPDDDRITEAAIVAARRAVYERGKADAAPHWVPGPPPDRGQYWIYWTTLQGERRVESCEIGSAVLNPGGRLLCKLSSGCAYAYLDDGIRSQISHHAPIVPPSPPEVSVG